MCVMPDAAAVAAAGRTPRPVFDNTKRRQNNAPARQDRPKGHDLLRPCRRVRVVAIPPISPPPPPPPRDHLQLPWVGADAQQDRAMRPEDILLFLWWSLLLLGGGRRGGRRGCCCEEEKDEEEEQQ